MMNTLLDTLGYFGFIFLELVVLFLTISAAVALALQYIPKERLNRYLSRKGPMGYLLAALLGSITPFCACSTIPLTLGLLNAGVSIGPILTFVLVSPLLNPIIVAMVWTLMGWKACLVYFVVCFAAALIGGWLMNVCRAERFVRKVAERHSASCCNGEEETVPATFQRQTRRFLPESIRRPARRSDLSGDRHRHRSNDLRLYPAGMDTWNRRTDNLFAVPLAALIGIPLYIRTESAIPIGLALVQKGMSLGAVIALIIGGAGMAIPEMSMLLSIFRVRVVAAIVALVFLTAVIGGYVFNWFIH